MASYPRQARERATKVEEVLLRAVSKQIPFWEAARILGYSRQRLRRVLQRYRHYGFDGLLDRRRGRPAWRPGLTPVSNSPLPCVLSLLWFLRINNHRLPLTCLQTAIPRQ